MFAHMQTAPHATNYLQEKHHKKNLKEAGPCCRVRVYVVHSSVYGVCIITICFSIMAY